MKIVVLHELTADVTLRGQSDDVSDERQANARRAPDDWHIYRVDPAAAAALALAVGLKTDGAGTTVTLLHLGPPDAEHWMREQLARGADDAIRVWDDEMGHPGTQAKALVLAAVVRAHGADLVLTGCENAASAGGQLGVLLARHLGLPCVTNASGVSRGPDVASETSPTAPTLHVTRELARGYKERVEVTLPAVLTVVPGAGPQAYASLFALLLAQEAEIPVWDLATVGVPGDALRRVQVPLRLGDLRPSRPSTRPVKTPDPSAPAFERILQLVAGSVARRAGRVVRGSDEQIAADVFSVLLREGWLDHLGPPSGDA